MGKTLAAAADEAVGCSLPLPSPEPLDAHGEWRAAAIELHNRPGQTKRNKGGKLVGKRLINLHPVGGLQWPRSVSVHCITRYITCHVPPYYTPKPMLPAAPTLSCTSAGTPLSASRTRGGGAPAAQQAEVFKSLLLARTCRVGRVMHIAASMHFGWGRAYRRHNARRPAWPCLAVVFLHALKNLLISQSLALQQHLHSDAAEHRRRCQAGVRAD